MDALDKEIEEGISDGCVIFSVDPSTMDIIYAVDGEDNSNYYSYNSIKDGVIGYPKTMNFKDLWFSQSFSLPEIKGFVKLVNESKEAFIPKNREIEEKFCKWGMKTLLGKIAINKKVMAILGNKKFLKSVIAFFSSKGYIDGETFLYIDNKPVGRINVVFSEDNKAMLPTIICKSKENDELLDLIGQYKTGNHKVMAQLLEKHEKYIRGMVNKHGKMYNLSQELKNDVLHEVSVKFLTKLATYTNADGNIDVFIHNSLTDIITSTIERKGQKLQNITPEPQIPMEVKDLINSLPDVQQKAVNLLFYSGKTMQEVSKELGVDEHTAKDLINQALDTLRLKLTPDVEALKVAMIFEKPKVKLCL